MKEFLSKLFSDPKAEVEDVPEHSIPIRVVVLLMAVLIITSSCLFAKVNLFLMLAYLAIAITGCLFSYIHRDKFPIWMKVIAYGGILGVAFLTINQFTKPLSTNFDFYTPFVLFLAGIFACLCYEMRTRADLGVSTVLGLILLCVTAPIAKGIIYGSIVLSYITLGVIMLYFDCISRTFNAWMENPIDKAPEVQFGQNSGGRRRNRIGTTIGAISAVPLLALLMFLFMPRIDDFVDKVMAAFKSMDTNYVVDSVMPFKKNDTKRDKRHKGQPAREWFRKNSDVLANLKKKENQKEKKEKFDKLKPHKKPPVPKPPEPKKKPTPNSPSAAKKEKEAESKNKTKKQLNKKKKKQSKVEEKKNKSAESKKDKKSKEAPVKKESKKADKSNPKETKSKSASSKDSKSTAKKDSKKSKAAGDKGKGKGAGKGKESGKGKGAGAGKGNGAGKDKGAGKGKGEGTQGGGGRSGFSLHKDSELDLKGSFSDSRVLLMKVKSRRLAYLRRNCFDNFDGKKWTVSKANTNKQHIKVVDGQIDWKSLVKKSAEQSAKERMVEQAQRQVTPQAQAPKKLNILAKPGSASDFKNGRTVVLNSQSEQPRKVQFEKTVKSYQEKYFDKLSKSRVYDFQSSAKPQFMVGLSDAFTVPHKYPSIGLEQEIQVKHNAIGDLIPGGWIPQELIIDKDKLTVDSLGVIKAGTPLKKGVKYKVKSQLAIFNLAYMRRMEPSGAEQEENIRDTLAQYLQIPNTADNDLFELAEKNTSPEFNWFVQSEQIAHFLRSNYKLDLEPELDPGSTDLVQEFLFKSKNGTSAQFASAFVMLNRCIGIPSRIVTGFSPGKLNRVDGLRDVRGLDYHAWAESYIPNVGWVPFDATPKGYLPAQQRETEYTANDIKKELGLDKKEKEAQTKLIFDFVYALIAGIIGLVIAVIIGRKLIQLLRNYLAKRTVRGPEWALYKKVLKTVSKSVDVKRAPEETTQEFLDNVQTKVSEMTNQGEIIPANLEENLAKFMDLYSKVYFGDQKEHMEDLKYYAELIANSLKSMKSVS